MAEGSAIVTAGDGSVDTWRWGSGGFAPPAGTTATMARDTAGALTLHHGSATTAFDVAGLLRSSSVPVDDADPASSAYTWTGTPSRLTKVTDPVSGREVALHYAVGNSDSACPLMGATRATDGQLCTVGYWDTTQTKLYYNSGAQLARIENPGGAVSDFAYGGDGLLSRVRDPLAADVVANGLAADTDDVRTVIGYSGGKVNRLVGPKAASAVSPGRSYTYPSATETQLTVDGLSTTTGYARKVTADARGRTLADYDATAKVTSVSWLDPFSDLPASVTDPAGRTTTYLYDPATFAVTDVYGPAPASCFNTSSRTPNGSCAPMPHSSTQYDGGMYGLAAAYWPNANLAGPPEGHDSVGGGAGGNMASDWATRPPSALVGATWSARLSGEVTFASASPFFNVVASGTATLFIDDHPVANGASVTGAAGSRHRIAVDYVPSGTPSLDIQWGATAGSYVTIPASALTPAYGLPTLTTTGDSTSGSPASVTAISYAVPHTGQPTAVIADPANLALTTNYVYEPSTPGHFGRRTQRTLPAGNAWGYGYYGNTATAVSTCPGATAANQGGLPHITTAPDPDGIPGPQSSRHTEVVHDAAGRSVATRVDSEPWTCVVYDARGRIASRLVPAFAGSPARTVTYNYAVGNDSRVTSVTDAAGTISTTVDLAGQVTSYTDAIGNTTTYTHDQPGRMTHTAGPALGWSTDVVYDAASRVTSQKIDGTVVATATYTAAGELDTAAYGNGTALSPIGRDLAGRTTSLTWTGPGGALASDSVTRSQSGRVMTETIDGAAAGTFGYDSAGRLATATVPGHTLSYSFAGTGGCGAMATAGKNTNRTSVVDNATTTTYCYDSADRLTSSSDASVGTPAYDAHGNTTTLGTQTLGYDGDDRHISTTTPGVGIGGLPKTVSYTRDASDRIIERKVDNVIVARYGYSGPGDSPAYTSYGPLWLLRERTVPVIGEVLVSKGGPNGDRWSYPNIHGDVMALADSAGAKVGATSTYDPFGQALNAAPDNGVGNFDYGWLGSHQRPTEHEAGTTTIEMGARPYVPSLGRFLEVDPVEGGLNTNDYAYTREPIRQHDIDGLGGRGSGCHASAQRCEEIRMSAEATRRQPCHAEGRHLVGQCETGLDFTITGSICVGLCVGGAYARNHGHNGLYLYGGFFGYRGPSLTISGGRPTRNVSTSVGVCYAVCAGAARDQRTRTWAPSIGVGTPGGWGGNFGYIQVAGD